MEDRFRKYISTMYSGYKLIDYSPLGCRMVDLFIVNEIIKKSQKLTIHLDSDNKIMPLGIEEIEFSY